MRTKRQVESFGLIKALAFIWLILFTFSTSALPQQGGEIGKALNGIDWKKLSQGISSDPDFQASVRSVFGALTPDAQRKVSVGLASLKEGKGPILTGTPVDAFVGKKLAKSLSPLVADPATKDALQAFEENGNLQGLIESITGNKMAAPTGTDGSKTAKSDGATANHRAVEKVIVGGTWTWHSSDPSDANTIEFAAGGVGSHGGRGNTQWEATNNRDITITHPTKGKAVIHLGSDQKSFTGKGYDGKPVSGNRLR